MVHVLIFIVFYNVLKLGRNLVTPVRRENLSLFLVLRISAVVRFLMLLRVQMWRVSRLDMSFQVSASHEDLTTQGASEKRKKKLRFADARIISIKLYDHICFNTVFKNGKSGLCGIFSFVS